MPERTHASRQGLAASGSVIQAQKLLATRIAIDEAMLVRVLAGSKTLRWAGRELTIRAGETVAVAGGQTFDILNTPDAEAGVYRAEWLSFDPALTNRFAEYYGIAEPVRDAVKLTGQPGFAAAFEDAAAALADGRQPALAVETALCGVRAWLHHQRWSFQAADKGSNLCHIVRRTIAADTATPWTIGDIAAKQHLSEATLRRHLAEAGTSFRTLLADVRMMRALTLLQISELPVARIAEMVGYESPSRFSVRFRQRFGFKPADVRRQQKTAVDNRFGELVRYR